MTMMAETGLPNEGRAATSGGRYAFIDVLRAVAACAVLFQHGGEGAGWFSMTSGFGPWINFGEIGVLAFFLVSGFVIPLSLERAGSLGSFWKHRVFRIYPLYLSLLLYELAMYFSSHGTYALGTVHDWSTLLLSHLFFVQEYTHEPNFVGASWTLSLEFAWYILLSISFASRTNRRSVLLTVITVVGLLTLTGVSLALHMRIPLGRVGIMASCIAGLLFYRLHTRAIGWRVFILSLCSIIAALVLALFVAFGVFKHTDGLTVQCVFISWSLAYLLFIGCYAGRNSPVMRFRPLLTLGTISYSVYLLHPAIMHLLSMTTLRGWAYMGILLLSTLVLAHFTYRHIEKPAIDYPRRQDRRKKALREIQAVDHGPAAAAVGRERNV
jgi:peptidoglycan/LPS O-acetylase OafA/YrhL